jgi:hypothetical protein
VSFGVAEVVFASSKFLLKYVPTAFIKKFLSILFAQLDIETSVRSKLKIESEMRTYF